MDVSGAPAAGDKGSDLGVRAHTHTPQQHQAVRRDTCHAAPELT